MLTKIISIVSLLIIPSAYALESWEVERLQGIAGEDVVFGGKRNIWDVSAGAAYTVGLGSSSDIECTATLISRRVLLTAGHCVLNPVTLGDGGNKHEFAYFMKQMKSATGSAGPLQKKLVRVASTIAHPIWEEFVNTADNVPMPAHTLSNERKLSPKTLENYKKTARFFYHDIALVILAQDAPKEFAIAALPPAGVALQIKPECSYLISGFGTDNSMPDNEQDGPRPSRSAFISSKNIVPRPVGIGIVSNPSICGGDSGGALLEFCGSRATVIGVASHLDPIYGSGSCESGTTSSNHTYVTGNMDFILENLRKISQQKDL